MANDRGTGFMLTRRAALSPERTALIFRDESWTYAELNRVTNRVAHGLHALGVNPGDRVVCVTPLWPNLVEIPKVLGARVTCVSLDFSARGWTLGLAICPV